MNNYQIGAKKQWESKRRNGTDVPWNKGKKVPQQSGALNGNWKGEGVSYSALHHWLRRNKGKPTFCSFDLTHKGRFEWANISKTYKRDLRDYMGLCKPCHRQYDKREDSKRGNNVKNNPLFFNRWTNQWEKRKGFMA